MIVAKVILNTLELADNDRFVLEALERFGELSISLCQCPAAVARLLENGLVYQSDSDVVQLTAGGHDVLGVTNYLITRSGKHEAEGMINDFLS